MSAVLCSSGFFSFHVFLMLENDILEIIEVTCLEINGFIQDLFFVYSSTEGDKFQENDPLIIPILPILPLALAVLMISTGFVVLFLLFT